MSSQTGEGVCFFVYDCECGAIPWHGRNGYVTVPADSARWHLDFLISRGHSTGGIAATVGVSPRTINRIRTKRVRMTARTTSDRIRGISADEPPAPGSHMVPAARVKPFVDEIRRLGWTYAEINRQSGCSHLRRSTNVSRYVKYETWRRVTTLYVVLARKGVVDGALLDGIGGLS